MGTVKEKIEELNSPQKDSPAVRVAILAMLPEELESPTISNIQGHTPYAPSAWLSFHGPTYDPNKTFDPVATLRAIEAKGWKTFPATLVQCDNYRPSPRLGAQENIPEKMGHYTVTASWPICPLWLHTVTGSWGTTCEARCFATAPDGKTYFVHLKTPVKFYVTAKRHNTRDGTWYYERGTAGLHKPDAWYEIHWDDKDLAQLSEKTRYGLDTEQSVSADLYWSPVVHEQADFPMSAADMLEVLLK